MAKRGSGFHQPFRDLKLPSPAPTPVPAEKPPRGPAPPQADENHLFAEEMFGVEPPPPDPRGRRGAPAPTPPKRKRPSDEAEAYALLCDLVEGQGPFDIADGDEFIETLPKHGYRFKAALRRTLVDEEDEVILEKRTVRRVTFALDDAREPERLALPPARRSPTARGLSARRLRDGNRSRQRIAGTRARRARGDGARDAREFDQLEGMRMHDHARDRDPVRRRGTMRELHRLPDRLPHRCIPRSLSSRCAPLHFLSDDRT